MNVLLVTMSMQIGGAETHVLELAKGLKKRGYTVYVMSNGGEYVKELEENNIIHIFAPLHNRKISNILKSYKILKQTVKEKDIDIVHSHARIPGMIANWVCKKMNVPLVATAHGIYRINPVLKALTSWGQRTITVSEDVKKYVVKEYGVKEKDVLITVNGIDLNKFNSNIDYSDIEKEFGINKNNKIVVHVSRLDEETSKVADFLIDIAEDFEHMQFVIVGSGKERERLKEKAKIVNQKIGENRIVMAGGRTDVNKFVALCDLFVGVSRAALEAMSAEKPVVLAGNQGYIGIFDEAKLEKALETNFCCRGFKQPSREDIKNDIVSLISISSNEKEGMGKYNRKIVKEYYSIDKMVEDAIMMYQQV